MPGLKTRQPAKRSAKPRAVRKAAVKARPQRKARATAGPAAKRKVAKKAVVAAKPAVKTHSRRKFTARPRVASKRPVVLAPPVETTVTLGPHHVDHLRVPGHFHVHAAPLAPRIEHQRVTMRHH